MTTHSAPSQETAIKAPKFIKEGQWEGYQNPHWKKKDKKNTTILFNFVERRKSFFFSAYFKRHGYTFIDLGDHTKEDLRWGKEYGNRMECNPMYFTSGSLIRGLFELERNLGLSKQDIVDNYVFLGGGGQCGPCRYGMYPQEYLKVVNDAGFNGFRVLVFSSDLGAVTKEPDSALKFNLPFRINMLISLVLADLIHVAECALRPYAKDKERALAILDEAEQILLDAFMSRFFLWKLPKALKQVGELFAAVPRHKATLPKIFVTGEFFANLAHNDGNYNLRRFIMDEGCEVYPGLFTQRILYDNWRRAREAHQGIRYARSEEEKVRWKKSLKKQLTSNKVIHYFFNKYTQALNPESFGGHCRLLDLDEMAELARDYYHPEIFGGESNLEVAEALHYAGEIDGFISSKPFGCMPSSGVSDGVQAKVLSLHPELNFLSIETSGDNDVNILSRVSMLLFKAKQNSGRNSRPVFMPDTKEKNGAREEDVRSSAISKKRRFRRGA